MSHRLGKRRYLKVYGRDAKRTDHHPGSHDFINYAYCISMTRINYDYHGEQFVSFKKGSAKAKHSEKLARYEDMALGHCYARKK